ncbi:MAG TPA: fused MFS/spermidine synthase [Tepidisphaeraceae bacterium]
MTETSADASLIHAPGARVSLRALAQPLVVPLFCLTLFCSSGLLFLAEPMFAKLVLPLLGGTPAVWNTCMVSFQALLLAAYAYGHWSIKWLGIRRQTKIQLIVLIAAVVALPIAIPHGWQPPAGTNPIFWLLTVLPIGVGLPFFAAASTAPVLQRWFSSTGHPAGKDPYFLYAASNLGSMIALLGYPTLVEPLLHLADQSRLWSSGYYGLIALVGCCALFVGPGQLNISAPKLEKIIPSRRVRWILLAMVPSSLLLGTTTFITTDIAAVPLLWIVPLALYLLSFILVFASRPIVSHRLMIRLQPVVVLGVALFMLGRVGQPVWMVLALHLAAFFVSSMVCHGELAKDRPSVGRLTDFYLTMSLGGVLGGLFNALLAPLIFHSAAEYPIALVAACALCPRKSPVSDNARWTHRITDVIWPILVVALAWGTPRGMTAMLGHDSISLRMIALGVAIMAAGMAIPRRSRFVASLAALFFVVGIGAAKGEILAVRRSFFGIHRVVRNPDGPFNDLYHGTTVHGRQFVSVDGATPSEPTTALTYYHRTGPIGQILTQRLAAAQANRIGVVGLGVGSLAAYAGRGTSLTYYEIDPAVRWVALESGYFSFLSSAENRGANVQIVMGDARLTLRDAPSHSYDVLVLDAFCGDAIPVHLLTREAMQIYTDKLADNGVLAIHVSNMYLDLLPVCSALVADAGCVGMYQNDLNVSPQQAAEGKSASQWVIIAKSGLTLRAFQNDSRWKPLPQAVKASVWTDDFSNILSVFRWR